MSAPASCPAFLARQAAPVVCPLCLGAPLAPGAGALLCGSCRPVVARLPVPARRRLLAAAWLALPSRVARQGGAQLSLL